MVRNLSKGNPGSRFRRFERDQYLGEIGENAIIVFEENVGVGAEEIVANQEYVAYTGDNEEVLEVNIAEMN